MCVWWKLGTAGGMNKEEGQREEVEEEREREKKAGWEKKGGCTSF